MKVHHLLTIGAAIALIVLTSTGIVGGPLGTLLLIGLLLLCPLMMGMLGGGANTAGSEHAPGAGARPRQSPEEMGRGGR